MMASRFRLACLPVLIAGWTPASAVAQDTRIATRSYDADEIVKLEGKLNVQATISFGENERIENVAVGDPDSWQIIPNKRADLLFVKPVVATARTNMTVVTDRHTYFFDLVASPTAKPVYALRFTYAQAAVAASPPPATPQQVQPSAPPSLPQSSDLAVLEAVRREVLADPGPPVAGPVPQPAIAIPPPPAWRRSGSEKLFPVKLHDDGASTFLQWAAGVPVPSLFTLDADGRETPLAYAVGADGIVVDGVPRQIVLRARRARAVLERTSAPAPVQRKAQSAMSGPPPRERAAGE